MCDAWRRGSSVEPVEPVVGPVEPVVQPVGQLYASCKLVLIPVESVEPPVLSKPVLIPVEPVEPPVHCKPLLIPVVFVL